MKSFNANSVEVFVDFDYVEGGISFQWPDKIFGKEGIHITLDGHCRRNMLIRSGSGPPEFLAFERDLIRLRFNPKLAQLLELDEEIEIRFEIDAETYNKLHEAIDFIKNGELK